MSLTLAGQTALVTGGSKGYGAGIAEALRRAGAAVWISGRDAGALKATAARLGVQAVKADVTKGKDWDRVFAAIHKAGGRLDILVNNAGGGGLIASTAEQTDAGITDVIQTNLTGAILGCRRAAPVMMKQKSGIIINVSSVCALYAWPGWSIYTAAKAGLNHFGHGLYTELRPHGVRVTTLTPSWGATEFLSASGIQGHPAAQADIRRQCIQPLELGAIVVQLCAQPAHLAVPDMTVQPLVQDITPM
jgi:NAD(P)-dependent dehydrogenase (short-subunit alcohol dehydrogenase family)